jgi:acetoin:2,6-dichlorophenolindophenol oxidoreductase subunit beta
MRELRYADALNETLRDEMKRHADVFVMGQDIAVWGDGGGVFGVTKGLVREFGSERIRDTPICEESMVALAVGAAATGSRPVVELMYSDFITLAMEPLVNQAAKLRYMFGGQCRVPMVLRTNLGASGGKGAQHSQSLETWVAHVPGLKVAVPATPADAAGLLRTAIHDDNPVVFFEHKALYFMKGPVPDGSPAIPFGDAKIVRSGRDLTLVATQAMLHQSLRVADTIAAEGIEVEVIDPRTLVPPDTQTILESVARTHRLLICHDAVERFGWAGEIAMQVIENGFDDLDGPIVRVCAANVPVPYSEPLERAVIPGPTDVERGIRRALLGSIVADRV